MKRHVAYVVHDHYWEDRNLLAGLRQAGHDVTPIRPGASFREALGFDWDAEDRERTSSHIVDSRGTLYLGRGERAFQALQTGMESGLLQPV